MKRTLFIILLLGSAGLTEGQVWMQWNNFPEEFHGQQASFTIGTKAYVYTGDSLANFYEFDQTTGNWAAKADFPGLPRTGTAGFSVGNYGYLGAGGRYLQQITYYDFYRYDPTTDTWLARANYPDSAFAPCSFAANGKGYVASGWNLPASSFAFPGYYFVYSNKCFEYNPATNQWMQRGNVPWTPRMNGFASGTGNKGYCGQGSQYLGGTFSDFWEYNSMNDTWTQKANCPLAGESVGFLAGATIAITDANNGILHTYNTATNAWSTKSLYADYCSFGMNTPVYGFSIANKGYLLSLNPCQAATNTWEYDANATFTGISQQGDSICEGADMIISLSSNLIFAANNYFTLTATALGLGSTEILIDTLQQTSPGSLKFHVNDDILGGFVWTSDPLVLTLRASNPPAIAVITTNFTVLNGPTIFPSLDTMRLCENIETLVSVQYRPDQTYHWTTPSFGPPLSISNELYYTPDTPTSLILISLVPQTGCTARDTAYAVPAPLPVAAFTDTFSAICYGSSATIGALSSNSSWYNWNNGGQAATITTSPTFDSWYTLQIIDTQTLCVLTQDFQVVVKTPPLQPLCMVTVDSTSSHNIIVWEKTDKEATDSFYIYREITSSNYQLIAAIHGDSLSEFHDLNANPNVTGYRYRLAVKDTCGNMSQPLSEYHNTIHLQYLGSGNLQWNAYEIEFSGSPVISYEVFVDALTNGNWQPLVTVPGSQTTATDANFSQHPNARYRVAANWLYTCVSERSAYGPIISNVITQAGTGVTEVFAPSVWMHTADDHHLHFLSTGVEIQGFVLYNAAGAEVSSGKGAIAEIGDLNKGIYVAEIITEKGSIRRRWLKM